MKVLVVEDEALVALDLADMIADLGHDVVGPFMSVEAALPLCRGDLVDFALVDFNLGRGTSERVADALDGAGVPFAFLTGYRPDALPQRFREVPILSKPLHLPGLVGMIEAAASGKARGPG
jgi:CheY-like chemotaxis protein